METLPTVVTLCTFPLSSTTPFHRVAPLLSQLSSTDTLETLSRPLTTFSLFQYLSPSAMAALHQPRTPRRPHTLAVSLLFSLFYFHSPSPDMAVIAGCSPPLKVPIISFIPAPFQLVYSRQTCIEHHTGTRPPKARAAFSIKKGLPLSTRII